jgi:hypothetical protein
MYRLKRARIDDRHDLAMSTAGSDQDAGDEEDDTDGYDEDIILNNMLATTQQHTGARLHSSLRSMTHPWYANLQPPNSPHFMFDGQS